MIFRPIEDAPVDVELFVLLPNRTAVPAIGSKVPFKKGPIVSWHWIDSDGYRWRVYPTHWMYMDLVPMEDNDA